MSVCSGIEAASVAWRPLGWEAVGFAEIEPFPCAVLAHHYPDVPNFGDMTKFEDWPDATFDVLCGGTPCQSFSNAGLRTGLDDPRGNLMLTFGAVAARYRPRWLLWENVPGVLSSNGGRDFGTFLGLLGILGYGFAYRVLDAQYFGLAQRRKRVFVVGCLGDWRRAAAVLLEPEGLRGDPAPRRGAQQDPAGTIAGGARKRGGYSTDDIPTTAVDYTNGLIGQISGTLEAAQSKNNRGHGVLAFDTTQITSEANRSNPQPGDPCHTLANGAHLPAIAFDARQSDAIQYGEKTGPLDTDAFTMGLLTKSAVRRLTPSECEALMGFPRGYTAITVRGKPAADGPRYKALGNSWAVPCATWIGRRIQMAHGI